LTDGDTSLRRVSDGRSEQAVNWRGLIDDWPITLLMAVLLGAFCVQLFVLRERAADYGVSAAALRDGRWWTLFTSMFIHAGLYHLVMNVSSLTIGAPVYRRLGRGVRGAALFFILYFACGLAGGLAFVALNPDGSTPAVGASGAIFGLWGALARLGTSGEEIAPLFSRAVGKHVVEAVKQNIVLIVLLVVLGFMSRGAPLLLAWQAHAGGFIAGLLLIGPFVRLARGPSADA
jgi:membrane associated rhomboid family serine protease